MQIAQDWKHGVAGSRNGRHSALKRAFKEHTNTDRNGRRLTCYCEARCDGKERTRSNCRYLDGNPTKLTYRAKVAGLASCEQTLIPESP